ncbi:MAG: IS110 family transposase [bacterium]|nr:IS110 family transposase [bacterium]
MKTDKVDAWILAQLLAADLLPPVWLPDDRIRMLSRLVHRRTHLVRQRTRLKNQVHAILARNLVPTCPHSDLFGGVGRRWLAQQVVPVDEQRSVTALLVNSSSTEPNSTRWNAISRSRRSMIRWWHG